LFAAIDLQLKTKDLGSELGGCITHTTRWRSQLIMQKPKKPAKGVPQNPKTAVSHKPFLLSGKWTMCIGFLVCFSVFFLAKMKSRLAS